jgi:hypothetical protein
MGRLAAFAMTSPDQFRPAGPPDLGSQAWTAAFNDVKSLGSASSMTRNADQTQIARGPFMRRRAIYNLPCKSGRMLRS